MTQAPHTLFAVVAATFLFALGCGRPAVDPAVVAEHRNRLELSEEPDGAQTVLEVRQIMYGVDPAESASGHADHDHEGDEHAHEGEEHAHEHAGAEHAEHAHDHAADAGDDVEPESAPGETTSAGDESEHADEDGHDHAHDEQEHADEQEHDEHEHADEHAHEDHDHDGDGVQDHAPEDHDVALDPFKDKEPVVSEMDVVMVGSVGGVPNPTDQSHPDFPFADGKAMFFLADPEAVAEMEEHEHKHAPGEECAFCLAHAGDSANLIAVVQFADEQGKPLNVDTRDLFDLKEKETVVVRGKAKIAPGGMLTVDATGLYVRR